MVSICSCVSRDNRFRRTEGRVYRASSIQLFSAEFGKGDEDSFPVNTASLN
jgi:hypothetical protein